jgi:hypothetical protein
MTRAVVCVATTSRYKRGMARMARELDRQNVVQMLFGGLPSGSPEHKAVPYAFKAYALQEAARQSFGTLLWCDASILPAADMTPLWERIERDGYWFARNYGWSNYEWTADSAYADLFGGPIGPARMLNRDIPHVVATAFGLSLRHPAGRAFLGEYYRLASETQAFCGPWINRDHPDCDDAPPDRYQAMKCYSCGPGDVRGHRHDQTAASVIAWRLGMRLTCAPEVFAYKGGESDKTILIADGSYV